jgi:Tfp pilus assembly protein FimV
MQFIKITIAGNDRTAVVLPVEQAGVAASLMANARVYERDGYYSTSGWKPAEDGIQIAYGDGDEFAPSHPKVVAAEKALEEKNSDWAKEYTARNKAEKELAEARAALAALQAATVCTRTEPAPDAEAPEEDSSPDEEPEEW